MCCVYAVCVRCAREGGCRGDLGVRPMTWGSAPVVKTTGTHPQVMGSRPAEVTFRTFPIRAQSDFPMCVRYAVDLYGGPAQRNSHTQSSGTRTHTRTHAHAHTHTHTRAHTHTYTHGAHTRTHTRGRPAHRPGHPSRGTNTRGCAYSSYRRLHTRANRVCAAVPPLLGQI